MTPEEAQALEHGLTPGGWNVDGDEYGDEILSVLAVTYDGQLIRGRRVAEEIDNPHDARLIAAAPDLAQTIAGLRWEWRCEADFDGTWAGLTTWESSPDYARATMQRRHRYPVRLVHRLVGPVEVTE